jgi:hypothetical protein
MAKDKLKLEDFEPKKYTSEEAIEMAVRAVKGMGLADYYERLISAAERRGYQRAVDEMTIKLNKMR